MITLLDRAFGGLSSGAAAVYVGAQVLGGMAGAMVANLMFGLDAVNISTRVRTGGGLWLGEAIATFGLALVVFGVVRSARAGVAAFAVGAFIGGAYFFTSSTSFANPAVTLARMFSDTFAGIAPSSVPAFIGFEVIGAAIAAGVIRVLYPDTPAVAGRVVVPQEIGEAG